jgi:peptidoglycan/LPS O-acetylase OafA/YrhL
MSFHFETHTWLPGGSLGVDVFFVLSGFLITTLLLQEWASSNSISLGGFYARRALRLLPALVAFLAIYMLISIGLRDLHFTGHQSQSKVLVSSLAALTYIFNWSYGALGSPRGFSHLWSLSIEEQFYLLWPGLLLILLRCRTKPMVLILISATLAALSAGLPLLADHYSRLYRGTDFRLQEFLAGSIIAQLYVTGIIKRDIVQSPAFMLLISAAIGFFVYWLLALTNRAEFLFNGWYTLTSVASSVLVAACIFVDKGLPKTLLANRVLVYIGRRSYALYLWHFPLSYWLRDLDLIPQVLLATALSFAFAEVSYRLVELPALRLKDRLRKHPAGDDVRLSQPQAVAEAA